MGYIIFGDGGDFGDFGDGGNIADGEQLQGLCISVDDVIVSVGSWLFVIFSGFVHFFFEAAVCEELFFEGGYLLSQ